MSKTAHAASNQPQKATRVSIEQGVRYSYQLQFRKCGKPSCSTCRGGQGHGPYWYKYRRQGRKGSRGTYVGKQLPAGITFIAEGTSSEEDASADGAPAEIVDELISA